MRLNETLITVFSAVFGLLALSSLIGAGLKLRIARGEPHAATDNLNSRVKGWWWMVLTLAFAFWAGKTGITVLFALAGVR